MDSVILEKNDSMNAQSNPASIIVEEGKPTDASGAPAPDIQNSSGRGKFAEAPPGVAGWSWGAFTLNWIWAIGNKTWIGLLCAIPYVGIVVSIYLGFHGRELAWQNKKWDSVEHFNRVQRKWSIWGGAIVAASITIGILSACFGD